MPTRLKMHDVKPRQNSDIVLFIGTCIVGCAGILLLKYYDFNPAWAEAFPVWAVAFPVAVLLFYASLAWALARFRLEPETIGDNCYYLGFIFTLVSLAWTLYGLTKSSENADLIREIVSGFGVALSSTIFGIFLRALFIQFRPDVVTSDREARIELNQAVREFKVELSQSVMRFREFSREVEQSLSEQRGYFEAADNERMERQAEWLKNYIETAGKEMAGVVNSATDTILKSVHERFDDASKDWTALLDTSSDRLAKAVDDYSARLNAASGKAEDMAGQLAASVGQMRDAIEKSSEAIDSAGTQVAERISRVAEEISKFKWLQAVAKDFEAAATTVSAASTTLKNTSTEVQAFIAELKDIPKSGATFDDTNLQNLEDAVREMTVALQKASHPTQIGFDYTNGNSTATPAPTPSPSSPRRWWRRLWS